MGGGGEGITCHGSHKVPEELGEKEREKILLLRITPSMNKRLGMGTRRANSQ